jgi:hypothetical protein
VNALRRVKLLLALWLLTAGMLACGANPPATATVAGPTPTADWPLYTNEAQGFSIRYPPDLQAPPADYAEPFGTIGDQIVFNISDLDPLDCQGDCPFVEDVATVEIAGLPATRIEGYIGSIGGNVPQDYLTYVIERGTRYYNFTLYAGAAPDADPTADPAPLAAEDVAVFEQMLATLQFSE